MRPNGTVVEGQAYLNEQQPRLGRGLTEDGDYIGVATKAKGTERKGQAHLDGSVLSSSPGSAESSEKTVTTLAWQLKPKTTVGEGKAEHVACEAGCR